MNRLGAEFSFQQLPSLILPSKPAPFFMGMLSRLMVPIIALPKRCNRKNSCFEAISLCHQGLNPIFLGGVCPYLTTRKVEINYLDLLAFASYKKATPPHWEILFSLTAAVILHASLPKQKCSYSPLRQQHINDYVCILVW